MNTKRITTTALATVVVALVPTAGVAQAHLPGKRAATSDARYAATKQARADFGSVAKGPLKVLANHRRTRHSRAITVRVPLPKGVAEYRVTVFHSYRTKTRMNGAALGVQSMRLIGGTTVAPSARTRAAARERARERRAERRSQRRAARNGWLRA